MRIQTPPAAAAQDRVNHGAAPSGIGMTDEEPTLSTHCGTVSSIMNSAGVLGASASPIVFGFFVQRGSWVMPFLVTAGMLFGGALIWAYCIDPERSVIGESRPAAETGLGN